MARSLSPKLFEKLRRRTPPPPEAPRAAGGNNINISIDLGAAHNLLDEDYLKKKKKKRNIEEEVKPPVQAPVGLTARPG